MIGTSLGHYRVLEKLGAGGMGEVYRARDTTLNRDVAIKVLPDLFATDPERLARFTREAQTLAALNHPNIAHIHGVEASPNGRALVMELVDGEDLAVQIARGPMPISDVLPIARQIAEALEAAHEQGIVHRDLKPANIKVRPDATVKVLDFGLAKAMAPESSGTGNLAHSPTFTAHATAMGMIVGTAAYMAPEQARGKAVDKRADIWAFGVVVYEMLTGCRTFDGEVATDVLAAVLRQDVDWARLPAATPVRLRRLLERCLDRDPRTRLRDIGEARVDFARLESGTPDEERATTAIAPGPGRSRGEIVAWTLAAAGLIAAFGLWISRSPSSAPVETGRSLRLSLSPPDSIVAEAGGALISPDGQKMIVSGRAADGRRVLWLRELDTLDATPLPDTEDALEPFWSPNSKSIGFNAQGKLKRLDLGATRAQILTDAARSNNGAWSPSGTIVFSPDFRAALSRVSADGGVRTPVTTIDAASGDSGHRYPVFLPDGRHFLYVSYRTSGAAIVAGALDSADTKVLLPDFGPAVYAAPGWLLYVRNGSVVAHAFDAERLSLSGDPIPLPRTALTSAWPQGARIAVSNTGVLTIKGAPAYDYQLAWYERDGKEVGRPGPVRKVSVGEFPRISPDGKRLLVQRVDDATLNQDLWIGDLARGTYDRLTTDPAQDQIALWSVDGKGVFWSTARNGVNGIHWMPAGGGDARLIVKGTVFSSDVSPDGTQLFFHQRGDKTRSDLWLHRLSGDVTGGDTTPSRVLINSEADEQGTQVSPDGHWVAYSSDVTGLPEVYVRRLTTDGGVSEATRVSAGGGAQPRWSRDGRELFFVSAPQGYLSAQMMAVTVTGIGTSVGFSQPRSLFKARMLPIQSVSRDYDISLDGRRFLIGTVVGDARPSPATIVLNWTAELKR